MAELWFNGKSSTDAGIRHVEKYPALNRPERQARIVDVPGRNGDVVQLLDAWNDYEQDYEIYGGDGTKGSAPVAFNSIYAWLNSATGYARLEDIYEPDYFRLAYFTGPMDVDNVFSQFGRATITFMCRPERFLKSAEKRVTMTMTTNQQDASSIFNPTGYNAKPMLLIPAQTSAFTGGTVTFYAESGNQYVITIDGAFKEPTYSGKNLVFDCETGDVQSAYNVNGNQFVSYQDGKVPVLEPGRTYVRYTGLTKPTLEYRPRFFEI